jgi:ribosomal-protein-alanine N-acetyltransferase
VKHDDDLDLFVWPDVQTVVALFFMRIVLLPARAMLIAPFPTLTSPRLRLREIRENDAEALFAIHSDRAVMRWYGSDPLTELSQMDKLIGIFATWRLDGVGIRWGIEWDGRLIGSCGFFRWNKNWHNSMLGYELAQDCQGQGLMREALTTILGYGFEQMKLHRLYAEIDADNAASIRLVTRLGFQFEGVHREIALWGGRWHDLNCYSLLEQEWPPASGQ